MDRDRERFEELFTTCYGAVVRYALRRVDPDTAREIVSETFLIAWRRLPEMPENVLPWLYATARRVIANELRRQHRSRAFSDDLSNLPPAEPLDPAEVIGQRLKVHAALAGLSVRDREVLRLRAWEQLSVADAAKVLGCSPAAYTVRLHRARRRLAALLGDDGLEQLVALPQGELS
ncbi:MAG TPA: sigma-70 family RNA polymerase sigma factor [Jatrophihabitans sp.]|jgi:RNA polymerase sigma-70 factor (ECF subfamily)